MTKNSNINSHFMFNMIFFKIIGKTFILHELRDDLGTGGDEGSEVINYL